MIRVKYERYLNDFCRKNEVKSFKDLSELEDWIFNQMQVDYTEDHRWMYFPTPKSVARYGGEGPGEISFTPTYGGENIWIHQIETGDGIIFSDGKFTAGKKHWSVGVQEWLIHCNERKKAPKFNFVGADDDRTYTVTEVCPHCETEVEIRGWNTERDGFEAVCPYCGGRLMLCDECQHSRSSSDCDYDTDSDSCHKRAEKRKLWLRLGVSVELTLAEELALLQGDSGTVRKLFEQNRFKLDGDSYIPEDVVKEYNEKMGTHYAVQDIGFEL